LKVSNFTYTLVGATHSVTLHLFHHDLWCEKMTP